MKLILTFFTIVLLTGCMQHKEDQIPVVEGTVTNFNSSYYILYKNDITKQVIDTIPINKKGKFYINQSSIDTTAFYGLETGKYEISLFLKPDDFIQISFDENNPAKTIQSSNSNFHNRLWQIEHDNEIINAKIQKIDDEFRLYIGKENADTSVNKLKVQKSNLIETYKKQCIKVMQKTNSPVLDYIILNQKYKNNSIFNLQNDLSLFLKNSDQLIRNKDLKPLFKDYDEQLLKCYNTIRNAQRHDSGEKFPSLLAKTKWNENIQTSQMYAKYILLVFWDGKDDNIFGRLKEIKHLSYKYSRRGLKMLFIAYQNDKKVWDNTVAKNKLPYWHTIDTLGIKSPDLEKLGIRSLPYNFLIAKDSTIIERGKWGEELDNSIRNIIKNN